MYKKAKVEEMCQMPSIWKEKKKKKIESKMEIDENWKRFGICIFDDSSHPLSACPVVPCISAFDMRVGAFVSL